MSFVVKADVARVFVCLLQTYFSKKLPMLLMLIIFVINSCEYCCEDTHKMLWGISMGLLQVCFFFQNYWCCLRSLFFCNKLMWVLLWRQTRDVVRVLCAFATNLFFSRNYQCCLRSLSFVRNPCIIVVKTCARCCRGFLCVCYMFVFHSKLKMLLTTHYFFKKPMCFLLWRHTRDVVRVFVR
jgi:hypothetical protein